jgi:hypothetical protein
VTDRPYCQKDVCWDSGLHDALCDEAGGLGEDISKTGRKEDSS